MGKTAESKVIKTKRYVKQYPQEFSCNPQNDLYCQLCATIIRCDKSFHVEQHQKSAKHQKKIVPVQETLGTPNLLSLFARGILQKML